MCPSTCAVIVTRCRSIAEGSSRQASASPGWPAACTCSSWSWVALPSWLSVPASACRAPQLPPHRELFEQRLTIARPHGPKVEHDPIGAAVLGLGDQAGHLRPSPAGQMTGDNENDLIALPGPG